MSATLRSPMLVATLLASLVLSACSEKTAAPLRVEQERLLAGGPLVVAAEGDFDDDAEIVFFAGTTGGESEVRAGTGAAATRVPIGEAKLLGVARARDGRARFEGALPFETAFAGGGVAVVGLVPDRSGALVQLGPETAKKGAARLIVAGKGQAVAGEPMAIQIAAGPRPEDSRVFVYVGRADDLNRGTSSVRVQGERVDLPFADAQLVAALPFESGQASAAFATAGRVGEGQRLPVAAVVVEDGRVVLVRAEASPEFDEILITDPVAVVAVLLAILAALFAAAAHPTLGKVFKVLPLLVFCYFTPTLFSNLGVIPIESPAYRFIKVWFLPASLILLTLSVDIPAILRLGKQAVGLFLTATITIVIGGPLAYLILHALVPEELGEETWKGLAALSGSWIGGTANMVAIGESVGVRDETFQKMIVVDVAVANVWMAVLLFFAGREKRMDEKIGADRSAIDRCRDRVLSFEAEVKRPTDLASLLAIVALAIGGTVLATWIAGMLPALGDIVSGFTWVVILVTTLGAGLSFTPLRRLEGAGASKVGSVLLYLLVASIGAHAEFGQIVDAPALVAIGAAWMLFHAVFLLLVRRLVRAPIFFAAVGSKANIGGAASAPIVAAAFHPALAPVGILLAVAGYVVGTYAGLLCAFLLKMVHDGLT